MSSMEPFSVDAGRRQQTISSSMTDSGQLTGSRTVPPPLLSAEIEIPLELVGCDEDGRPPKTLDDSRPRPRRKLTVSSASEGQLGTLHEEEVTSSSSSSPSSSQSSSPCDDDWTVCCSDKLADRTVLDGELAVSDTTVPVDSRQLSAAESELEAVPGSTAASTTTSEWAMTSSRPHHHHHHGASGLTARLGNLLNSAVMRAQKQLSRGQHTGLLD